MLFISIVLRMERVALVLTQPNANPAGASGLDVRGRPEDTRARCSIRTLPPAEARARREEIV